MKFSKFLCLTHFSFVPCRTRESIVPDNLSEQQQVMLLVRNFFRLPLFTLAFRPSLRNLTSSNSIGIFSALRWPHVRLYPVNECAFGQLSYPAIVISNSWRLFFRRQETKFWTHGARKNRLQSGLRDSSSSLRRSPGGKPFAICSRRGLAQG